MEQLAQPWGSEQQQQQEPQLTMEQQLQVAQEERNELIKTLLEMRQELDTLRNRPVPRPTPQPRPMENLQQGPRQRRMPKVAVPQPFTGKMSKLDAFKTACYMYMQGRKDEFEDEDAKIIWILSYLQGGTALKWREVAIKSMMEGEQVFEDSKELLETIRKTFGDPNEDTHVFQITTMVQGDKTADEHVQDFKIAAHGSGYVGTLLIYEFKRSLNKGLREWLNNLEHRPITIKDWYNEAMQLDCQWRQAHTEEKMFGSYRNMMMCCWSLCY